LLVTTAIKEKANYILTAHHLDDLVETIAFRLIRGSSIAGISGFKEDTKISNVNFIKPLMEVSKQEIIEYATTNYIEYYEDASNSTDDYSRNIIRNKLVPHFETINPQYRKSFLLFHEQQNELMEFLNYEALKLIKNNIVHIKDYVRLPILLRTEVLVNFLEKNKIKYTYKKIEMLDKELFNKPNIKQVLESNNKVTKYLVKEYDKFGIETEKNIDKIPFKDISVPLNKWVKIPFYYDTRKKRLIRRIFVTETDQITDNVRALLGKICYNDKCLPLLLRKRKDGDLLEFAYGHKKLSRFIIDNKITAAERKEILILASLKDDIIWIPNLYLNSEMKGESFLYIYGDDKQVGE
jgi:tRNA(Ile)-lysidine synthase